MFIEHATSPEQLSFVVECLRWTVKREIRLSVLDGRLLLIEEERGGEKYAGVFHHLVLGKHRDFQKAREICSRCAATKDASAAADFLSRELGLPVRLLLALRRVSCKEHTMRSQIIEALERELRQAAVGA